MQASDAIRRVLAPFPRVALAIKPTAIHLAPRISARLERRVWIMRDDLTGFALGGNKVRKLEYLVGDAIAKGADTLVVANASSFSRNAAAAASAHGLELHVLVFGDESTHNALSRAYFAAMGAKVHYAAAHVDLQAAQAALADTLRASGRRVAELHPGGSDAIGTLAYVEAFAEIVDFMTREGLVFDQIFHASGSAATQAGLTLGRAIGRLDATRIVGIAVSQPKELQTRRVATLCEAAAALLGVAFDPSSIVVDDRYLGEGYPIPSPASRAAVDQFAREEGLLFDPVYAGKAAAALLGQAKAGELDGATNVLLIHTGGNAGAYG